MKDETPREMVLRIASRLRKRYGNTLIEGNADIQMAVDVVNSLRRQLSLHPGSYYSDMTRKEFITKRKRVLKREWMEYDEKDLEDGWQELQKVKWHS